MASTHQQGPRSNNEVLSSNDNSIDSNYFEEVNNAFEQEFATLQYKQGETVREIIAEHETESSTWDKVMDFFASPVEGVKWLGTKALDWFMGTRVAQFLFGDYIQTYTRAQERLESARQAVDTVVDEGAEFISENPILAGLGATLVGVTGFATVRRLLGSTPTNPLSALRMLRRVPVSGLLRFGAIGGIAYGGYRLYDHLATNPELLEQIPEGAEEQRQWIIDQIHGLGLEGLSTEKIEQHANDIAALILGETTLEEIQERIDAIGEYDESNETNEDIPEGWMPLDEYIEEGSAKFEDIFSGVQANLEEHQTLITIAGIAGGGAFLTSSFGRGFMGNGLESLKFLAKLPIQMGATNLAALSIAMYGLYLLKDDASHLLRNHATNTVNYVGDKIIIPVDPEERGRLIREAIDYANTELNESADWIGENVNLESEEFDAAVEYIANLDLENINFPELNPQRFIRDALIASSQMLAENPETLVLNKNIEGIQSMIRRLRSFRTSRSDHDYQPLIDFLESLETSTSLDTPLTQTQINELISLSEETDIVISGPNEGKYYWTTDDGENGPFNLFIDPNLSNEKQIETAETFLTNRTNLAGSLSATFEMFGKDSRELASNMAQRLAEGDVLAIVGSNLMFITESTGESFILGPINIWTEVLDELTDLARGDELGFEVQEVMTEYGDILLPLTLIGGARALAHNGSGISRVWKFGRIMTRPLTLPLEAIWRGGWLAGCRNERQILGNQIQSTRFSIIKGLSNISDLGRQMPILNRFITTDVETLRSIKERGALLRIEGLLLQNTRLRNRLRLDNDGRLRKSIRNILDDAEISEHILRAGDSNILFVNNRQFEIDTPEKRSELIELTRNLRADIERGLTGDTLRLSSVRHELDIIRQRGATPDDLDRINEILRNSNAPEGLNITRIDDLPSSIDLLDEEIGKQHAQTSGTRTPRSTEAASTTRTSTTETPHRSHTTDAPSTTRGNTVSTRRGRARGIGAFIAGVSAVPAVSAVKNWFRRDERAENLEITGSNITTTDNSLTQTEQIERAEEIMSDDSIESAEQRRDMVIDTFAPNIGRLSSQINPHYQECLELLDRDIHEPLSERELRQHGEALAATHEANINTVKQFVIENREEIIHYFENVSQDIMPINPFFQIRYNQSSGELTLEHDTPGAFKSWLMSNIQTRRSHRDQILEHGEVSFNGRDLATAGAYAIPVAGTLMDGWDTIRAVTRGDWRQARESAAWTVAGVGIDIATFVPEPASTAVGLSARAARGARAVGRTAQFAQAGADIGRAIFTDPARNTNFIF